MTLAETKPSSLAQLPDYEEPELVLKRTAKWAESLMKVVTEKEMFADISGKQYLEVEAWQLVATFAQAHAIPEEPLGILDDEGNVISYQATAHVMQGGAIIGSGVSECGLESFPTQGKEGREKHKAAKSAAQTWAISKAIRNTYGFVAKLAGFEATTADEMRVSSNELKTDPMMFCPIHQKEWFRRGKMKELAHPVEGEKGPRGGAVWCNMDDVMNDLRDRMKEAARVHKWSEETLVEWRERWPEMSPAERLKVLDSFDKLKDSPEREPTDAEIDAEIVAEQEGDNDDTE